MHIEVLEKRGENEKFVKKIEKVYWADEYSFLGTPLNSAFSDISMWSKYINFMEEVC